METHAPRPVESLFLTEDAMRFYCSRWMCFVTVFDITYDKNGYPMFLVFHDGQWLRMSAKYFTPMLDPVDQSHGDSNMKITH